MPIRKLLVILMALLAGTVAAVALADTSPTTGTNTACATATTPDHTVGVDGTDVHTIPGDTATQCHVETYTIPTNIETVTETVTQTTTTPPPPSPHGGATVNQTGLATDIGTTFGTFQSHSSRAAYVSGGGIFVAYLAHWINDNQCSAVAPQPAAGLNDGCANTMNVDRSTDGGTTFSHVLQIKVGSHAAPSLETDSAGDVYAIVGSIGAPDGVWVYRMPAGNWASPVLAGTLRNGYSDKTSSGYDPAGQSAANGGTLWMIRAGNIPIAGHNESYINRMAANGWGGGAINTQCTSGSQQNCYLGIADEDTGPLVPAAANGAYAQYPEIYFDRSGSCPTGQSAPCDLALMAWTESTFANTSGYYDIHYIVSADGGQTWYGKDGRISRWPILSGDDGNSWQLLASSEYNSGGNSYSNDANWLANIYVQDGHLFFFYRHQGSSGLLRRVTPTWTGSGYTMANDVGPVTVRLGDGNQGAFFSGYGTAGSRIFLTGRFGSGPQVRTVSSVDGGQNWSTYASDAFVPSYAYSVSGGHGLGPGGQVIGAYTDQASNAALSDVYFIHNP